MLSVSISDYEMFTPGARRLDREILPIWAIVCGSHIYQICYLYALGIISVIGFHVCLSGEGRGEKAAIQKRKGNLREALLI